MVHPDVYPLKISLKMVFILWCTIWLDMFGQTLGTLGTLGTLCPKVIAFVNG